MSKLSKLPIRTLLLRLLARVHVALLAANVCVMLFVLLNYLELSGPVDVSAVFFRSLLAAVPAALSFYALRAFTRPATLFPAFGGIVLLSWFLMGNFTGPVMAALFCFYRFYTHQVEPLKRSHLDAPHPAFLLVFGVGFAFSAFYKMPLFQRLTIFSLVIYVLVWAAFQVLERLSRYLEINRTINNLPSRRIRRMIGVALAFCLLLGAGVLLPLAAAQSGGVQWDAAPKAETPLATDYDWELPDVEVTPWQDLDDSQEEAIEVRFPSEIVFPTLGATAVVLLALLLRKLFGLRWTRAENGDEIHSLTLEDEKVASLVSRRARRPSLLDRSPNGVIRRAYRKRVRRGLTDPPAPWQSPAEIEADASLADPTLHDLYEKARYGPTPCTPADARRLKRQ